MMSDDLLFADCVVLALMQERWRDISILEYPSRRFQSAHWYFDLKVFGNGCAGGIFQFWNIPPGVSSQRTGILT